VEALVARLDELRRDAECTQTALAELPKLPGGTSLANVALGGLDCARRAPEGSPARKSAAVLARAAEQIALDETVPILADDRSGIFESTVDARAEDRDTTGAKELAARWADFLERQARAATTPAARAVFDAHRVLAYTAIGDPARAIPMLTDSLRDFQSDYNPPARLAKVYLDLGRYGEGLSAVEQALTLAYGPRKMRYYLLKADLQKAKGDPAGALATLREARAYAAALPAAEKPTRDLGEVDKRLAAGGKYP
jgi:tetratricopeptide (TPR) repeat protein